METGAKANRKGFPILDGLSKELDECYKGPTAIIGLMNENLFSLQKGRILGIGGDVMYESTINVTQASPLSAMPYIHDNMDILCEHDGLLNVEIADTREYTNADATMFWLDSVVLNMPIISVAQRGSTPVALGDGFSEAVFPSTTGAPPLCVTGTPELKVSYFINDCRVAILRAIPIIDNKAMIGIGLKNVHLVTNIVKIKILVNSTELHKDTTYSVGIIKQWFHQKHARGQFASVFTKESEEFNKWRQPGMFGEGIQILLTDHLVSKGPPREMPKCTKAVIIRSKHKLDKIRFLGELAPAWMHECDLFGLPTKEGDENIYTYMWRFSEGPSIHQYARDPFRRLDEKTYCRAVSESKVVFESKTALAKITPSIIYTDLSLDSESTVENYDAEYIFVRSRIWTIKDDKCEENKDT